MGTVPRHGECTPTRHRSRGFLTPSIQTHDQLTIRPQDDVLAGELPLHQGCVRHAPSKDGRVDGECGEGHRPHHGRQSLHISRVQEADAEVAALKARYEKVKAVADTWVKKAETLLKEWTLLDNTVSELNTWVAKDKTTEGENQFSLEKMESTLGELKNIFKEKEKLVENL